MNWHVKEGERIADESTRKHSVRFPTLQRRLDVFNVSAIYLLLFVLWQLDRTYTGLQTLGAETVRDTVWIYQSHHRIATDSYFGMLLLFLFLSVIWQTEGLWLMLKHFLFLEGGGCWAPQKFTGWWFHLFCPLIFIIIFLLSNIFGWGWFLLHS